MAKEAEAHSAEDKQKREEVETRNQLDAMVYQVEKMLKENGDKISGGERGEVENAVGDAKKALESGDHKSMQTARDRLQAAQHKLAEAMYKSAAPPDAGAAGPQGEAQPKSEAKKDDGVIDAEYVDVEDKK
jgi:molecular chaperone DnaK